MLFFHDRIVLQLQDERIVLELKMECMKIKKIVALNSLLLLLTMYSAINTSAQLPLVYDVENTGASCTRPVLPTLANLTPYAMLPDPFRWSNGSGRIASFADWTCRRNEIKAEIENYEIGVKPARPANITASWNAGTSTLTVNVTENGQTLTLTSRIVLPSGTGPFPAIIGMNSATGSLPANVFSSRNIAQITYNHNQVTTYNNKSNNDPFFRLYPALTSNGQYSAWAWGVSRLIDGLELVKAQLPIDLKHIGVTGCSYAGKMALFSGALDERIALTIPVESGGGGSAAWRVSETLGQVEKLGATNFSWFMQSMNQFAGNNVPRLPHDHHELLAMIAPRALLVLGNSPDWTWLAEEASYVSARAAEDVYKTFGISDRFGFSQVGGHGHCEFPSTQNAELTAFVDKFLLGKTANTTVFKHLFPNTDYNRWITAWKGLVLPPPNTNAPVVTITAPLNNVSYTEGDNVTINAAATVPTGTISKVDFYQGTTLLGTDATAPYTFTWNNVSGGKYAITAKATSATNDVGTSAIITILVTKAVFQTGSAPVIDGTIDAVWNSHTAVPITNVLSGTVSSSADLSGNWRAMWDAANLYVLVQVTDDVKRNDAATDVYNDDGVEVYFDFGNNKPTAYGTNDHQYTFRWNDATAAYEINGHPVTGIVKGIVNTTTGYVVEVSIPWTTIGGVPTVNSLQGFDVMINDDDNAAARDKKMAWFATADDTWNNPSLMGTVVLKGLNCTPPAATITAMGATAVCFGSTVTLNANAGPGFTYVWKKDNVNIAGATAASYEAATSGSYTVSVTSGGCSATSTATALTVHTLSSATITVGSATTFCSGGSVTLTAGSGSSYIWKNGTTQVGTLATYTATTSGSYTVEITNANNCKAVSAPTVVTVNAMPSVPTVAALTYCQNVPATVLTATGTSLKWYADNTTATALANPPTPSTATAGTINYYVSQTTNGCESSRATLAVTVYALPVASVTAGAATTFCSGGSVTLTASFGSSYIWKNGTTQVGTSATYTATTSGSYTVEVTNANNCKAVSAPTVVSVNAMPSVPTVAALTYCQNAPATVLTATGTSLKWYADNTTATALANPPTPSTAAAAGTINYYVSQTTNGCESARAQITVTVNALPSAVITTVGSTTIPAGGSVTLNANSGSGFTYKWFKGSVQVSTAASLVANTPGSYVVEVTNASGCKATSLSVDVNAAANQPSVITITSPVTGTTAAAPVTIEVDVTDADGGIVLVEYLDGNTVIGTGTSQPYIFDWTNPGDGTHVITVRVTDSNGGITTSAPVTVTIHAITTGLSSSTVIYSRVYPVPARDEVMVETDMDLTGATFSVINILGNQYILSAHVFGDDAQLDVSGLEAGNYILFIHTDSKVVSQKITVIK
jgi:hypothetical protein